MVKGQKNKSGNPARIVDKSASQKVTRSTVIHDARSRIEIDDNTVTAHVEIASKGKRKSQSNYNVNSELNLTKNSPVMG